MARLWSTGFELQSVTAGMELETITGSPTINTSIKRSGAASLRCNPTAASWYVQHTWQADATNTHYERFYVYVASMPSAKTFIWQYLDSGSGIGFSLQLTNAGVLSYVNNNAGTADIGATTTITTGTWYRVEIKLIDSATTTGTFEWKVDGTIIATNTSQTGLAGGGRSRYGVITAVTADLYFDDIAVNDTSGSSQTAYPGAGSIFHLYPATAGDNAGWTPLASTNISNVNETPTPNDATSYNSINSSATAGTQIDDFIVGSPITAGIGSGDTVTLVQIGIRGGSTATTAGATINCRIKSASGGTTTVGTAADAYNVNGWRTNGATPFQYGLTSYTDPTTAAAWTVTGTNSLTNMQIGYTNAAANTTVRRVSSVWALVETIPSVGSPSASLSPSASISPSASRSPSASISPSASASASISPSASVSPSSSSSASRSPSASISPSASVSPSSSVSASISPSASSSASISPSASRSPSSSASPSISPSSSTSPSSSVSPSLSPSASRSPSASASSSTSPSSSQSPSSSVSASTSPSSSASPSPSASLSPSLSPSASVSASPSPAFTIPGINIIAIKQEDDVTIERAAGDELVIID